MSFGKLGAMGRGMGHLGSLGGASPRWLNATTLSALQDGGFVLNTHRQYVSRYPVYFGFKPKNNTIRLVFENWYLDSTGIFNGNTGIKTIQKVAIEKGDGSTYTTVSFDSGRSYAMAAGEFGKITLDVVLPWTVSRGDKIYVRNTAVYASTGTARMQDGRMVSEAKCYTYPSANHIDQVDGTGVLAAPTSSTAMSRIVGGPSFILAVPDDPTTAISCVAVGDSQISTNDTMTAVPVQTGATWLGRAANDNPADGAAIGADVIAMARLSCTGASLHGVFGAGVSTNKALYPLARGWFNVFIPQIQINDGSVYDVCVTDYNTLLATARAGGIKRVVGTYLTPLTNGSGSAWTLADGSDQVYGAVGGVGGKNDLLNQYRASLLGNGIDVLVDFDSVRLGSDPLKWLADGNPATYTYDGLHTSLSVGNAAQAAEARTGILAAAAMGL
jgi:hypothetical protein